MAGFWQEEVTRSGWVVHAGYHSVRQRWETVYLTALGLDKVSTIQVPCTVSQVR